DAVAADVVDHHRLLLPQIELGARLLEEPCFGPRQSGRAASDIPVPELAAFQGEYIGPKAGGLLVRQRVIIGRQAAHDRAMDFGNPLVMKRVINSRIDAGPVVHWHLNTSSNDYSITRTTQIELPSINFVE